MPRTPTARARRVRPDAGIRAADILPDPDYVDAFELATGAASAPAEQWARATFEQIPGPVRWFLLLGWRFGLGLGVTLRPAPDRVLGWPVLAAAPDRAVLGVPSRVLGAAHLVVLVEPGRVVLATFVRFQKRGARALWTLVGPLHRRINPYLLTRAARTVRSGPPDQP